MQPKAGNLTTAQNQMEIPLENSQSQKRRRKNPEQNAVAGKESKLKLMHNQLLSPLLNIFSIDPSCMHAFASPSRQQPQNPDYFETTVFGTRAKRHQIS